MKKSQENALLVTLDPGVKAATTDALILTARYATEQLEHVRSVRWESGVVLAKLTADTASMTNVPRQMENVTTANMAFMAGTALHRVKTPAAVRKCRKCATLGSGGVTVTKRVKSTATMENVIVGRVHALVALQDIGDHTVISYVAKIAVLVTQL